MESLNFKKNNRLVNIIVFVFIISLIIAVFVFEKAELIGKALAH